MKKGKRRMSMADAVSMRGRAEVSKLDHAEFVRQEADRFIVSLETIRRVLRFDTYRHFEGSEEGRVVMPIGGGLGEPTEEDIRESQRKFQEMMGMTAGGMVKEMVKGPKGPEGSWDD